MAAPLSAGEHDHRAERAAHALDKRVRAHLRARVSLAVRAEDLRRAIELRGILEERLLALLDDLFELDEAERALWTAFIGDARNSVRSREALEHSLAEIPF